MSELMIGYIFGALLYKQPDLLRAVFGFIIMVEMKAFMNGKQFELMFMEYVEICVFLEQKRAFELSGSRERGFNIEKIER